MIRLIVLVAAMVAGLIFGPQASGNKGYVLISLGNYTVESSVTSAVILAVLFYGALLIVEWLLGRVFGLRRKTLGWYGSRRRRKANQQTVAATPGHGRGALQPGRKLMLKGASNSDTPLLNYLSAAKAAQARGDDVRRDQYLQKAREENPKGRAGTDPDPDPAADRAGPVRYRAGHAGIRLRPQPAPPHGAGPAAPGAPGPRDWAALIDLIPVLHKVGKLTPKQEEDLLQQAWRGRLDAASGASRPCARSGRSCRASCARIRSAGRLWRSPASAGADNEAAELWLDALRKQVSPQLLARLPKLKLDSYQPMLTLLQKIQDQPGVDAALAQVYLLAGQTMPRACWSRRSQSAERRRLPCPRSGDGQRRLTNKANEYYRQALQLADV